MEFYVLNRDFEIIKFIDSFISLIWVKRYFDTGEFVLNINADIKNIRALQKKHYLVREDDEQICIIEKIKINSSVSESSNITVSGRSIESILSRRIIWNQTNAKTNETVEAFIRRLVTENCISPADPKRKIDKLILGKLKGFTEKISIQKTGDNILTAIIEICKTYSYGFKITMNEEGYLVFDLYKGIDRSYQQNENSYVVFSSEYDNLLNTEYEYDESNIANVALIGGEGEGVDRKYQSIGNYEGLDRYELFVDSKDISSNEGKISESEYNALLIERGEEKIAEHMLTESFTGQTENTKTYLYNKDYFLGDIVQIEDNYDLSASPRIIEIIENEDEKGYKIVPTYATWEV